MLAGLLTVWQGQASAHAPVWWVLRIAVASINTITNEVWGKMQNLNKITRSCIVWDFTSCNPLVLHRRFGRTRWWRYVPPTRPCTAVRLPPEDSSSHLIGDFFFTKSVTVTRSNWNSFLGNLKIINNICDINTLVGCVTSRNTRSSPGLWLRSTSRSQYTAATILKD